MNSTEAAGFLLANSTAVAESDTVIEAVQPSLVLSASSVKRSVRLSHSVFTRQSLTHFSHSVLM